MTMFALLAGAVLLGAVGMAPRRRG